MCKQILQNVCHLNCDSQNKNVIFLLEDWCIVFIEAYN